MPEHKPGVAPTDWPTQLQWLHMHFPRVVLDLSATVTPTKLEVFNSTRCVAWCVDRDLPTVVGLVFGELSRGHFPEALPDV